MTGPSITVPTVDSDNGTWGTTLNTAINQINDYDVFKYKTADESVTSSTTLQDDDHLTAMSLGVGTYIIEAMYLVSGAAAGDVKIAWAFSGTATASYRAGQGPTDTTTSVKSTTAATTVGVNRSAAAGDTTAAITSATPYGVDGTNWSYIYERGLMVVTVAGTLKTQWAQLASSGTATVMRTGSWMWARRVA